MPTLKFNPIQQLTTHFSTTSDTSPWNLSYGKQGATVFPTRSQQCSITQVLRPTSALGYRMNDGVTGLYLMAFDLPTPHIYVGIAAAGGRAPEGVLNRMRKHCIKTMGMNGGLGVHHPKKWQQFALARYQFMQQRKTTDKLEDVRFLYGSSSDSNPKATLEHFEAMICSNHQNSLTDICNQLWPETPAGNITLITQGHTQPGNFSEYEIQLS